MLKKKHMGPPAKAKGRFKKRSIEFSECPSFSALTHSRSIGTTDNLLGRIHSKLNTAFKKFFDQAINAATPHLNLAFRWTILTAVDFSWKAVSIERAPLEVTVFEVVSDTARIWLIVEFTQDLTGIPFRDRIRITISRWIGTKHF